MNTSHNLFIRLIFIFCTGLLWTSYIYAVDYKDAPKLEPYKLEEALVRELTKASSDASESNSFQLNGIKITAKDLAKSWGTLLVDVDSRLNLWRGRPNDLASGHLGSMELHISSIVDGNGNNLHDASNDRPWSNKIVIYNLGNDVFQGSRSINFKPIIEGSGPVQIAGNIKLSLPVYINKYIVNASFPKSASRLAIRRDISEATLNKNGIKVKHPKSMPDFKMTVMGFNKKGERINVSSSGTGGSNKDNHWYYFSSDAEFSKMLIFIPRKFVELEIPFTIDVQEN